MNTGVDHADLAQQFEADRGHLKSVAFQLLGSVPDAEDAVQAAWLKASRCEYTSVANLSAWLTTITAHEALDQLRARKRRAEQPLNEAAAGERFAVAAAGRGHGGFGRPGRAGPAAARPACRLRPARRLRDAVRDDRRAAGPLTGRGQELGQPGPEPTAPAPATAAPRTAEHVQVVRAFLAASRGGDIDSLVRLLAPGVVRTVDPSLVPADVTLEMRGARAVAEETRRFTDRARAGAVVLIDGSPASPSRPPVGWWRCCASPWPRTTGSGSSTSPATRNGCATPSSRCRREPWKWHIPGRAQDRRHALCRLRHSRAGNVLLPGPICLRAVGFSRPAHRVPVVFGHLDGAVDGDGDTAVHRDANRGMGRHALGYDRAGFVRQRVRHLPDAAVLRTLPTDLEEAAILDGCSPWQSYWRILLPHAKPAVMVLAVLTWVSGWNDFLWPLLMIQRNSLATLTLGLVRLRGEYVARWPVLMATSILVMLPLILIYAFAQRSFVRGIAVTGMGG